MNFHSMQLENKSMQYIVTIDKYQSITKAAAELYISQPSLSKFLKNLESRIGFQIFNRIGNHFIPTREGEVYIEYAKRICELEYRLSNELTDFVKSNRGRLRLALPILRSSYILPYIIPPFRKKYPGVEIQIFESYSRFLKPLLLEGGVDFAILNTAMQSPDIYVEVVRQEEVLLAASPTHPLAEMGSCSEKSQYPHIDISLFADEEFILQPPDQRTRQIADVILSDAKIEPRILLTTRSIETALKMVAQNCGICFVGETHIKHIPLPRQPRYFSLGHPAAMLELAFAHIKGVYQPAYFQDFMTIMRENL